MSPFLMTVFALASLLLSDPGQIGEMLGIAVGTVVGLAVGIVAIVVLARRAKTAPTEVTAGCPRCGETATRPVGFTLWGGALGPKLLSHVECSRCSHRFNGKTGQDNTVGIAIYLGASFVIGVGLAIVVLGQLG